jgi:hypothetical protein
MKELPKHLRTRPSYGGFIVPYFVAWFVDDQQVDERAPGAKPDFKVTDIRRLNICRQRNVCWICGKQLGSYKWFIFGPSSALGRISVEPPSHRDCAHYAVQTCPYMLTPGRPMQLIKKLRPHEHLYDIDEQHPDVAVLWATKDYGLKAVDPSRGVFYFIPSEPDIVEFWQAGRKATREEVVRAIDKAIVSNNVDRNDRDIAWRIEHLMRYAPTEERAA